MGLGAVEIHRQILSRPPWENSVMAVSCPYLDLLQRGQGKNRLGLWSTVTASKSIGVDLALLLSHCWKFIEDWKEMGQR